MSQLNSEQRLIRRCLNGEMAAYRQLYEQHKEVLYNLALRLHGNVQDAEDSLQEAFVKIYRSLPKFEGKSKLSTWLYKIVVNTCLTNLKRRKLPTESYEKVQELATTLSNKSEDHTLNIILEQEIARLPEGYRAVFILYEVEGFPHQEIAEILGITVGTSKSQLHRAKRILRKRLQPYWEVKG